MIFTVLIAANGYQTQLAVDIDSAERTELKFELDPLPTDLPATQRLRGKVVDERGKPVFGAVVSILGALQNDRKSLGNVKNVDRAAVTGVDGTFLLTSTEGYMAWQLCVNATAFVELKTELLKTGDTQHQLVLDPGSNVSGAIVQNGKPVPGMTVGICQTDRGVSQFAGEYTIVTDKNGRFLFTSVVADNPMTVYSKMGKGNRLATEIAEFTSEKSGALIDLGEFELRPAKTVTGRISLIDGNSMPQNSRMLVSREYAWDFQIVDIDENGYFQIKGVPLNEAVNISPRITGYSIDHSKTNLQVTGRTGVAVFTDEDLEHLEIFLKPEIK